MTLYIVRHSLAVPKKEWVGDDVDRPLTKRGINQSQVLARWSIGIEVRSILSSPTRRCLDTVAGIAAAHDLPVHAHNELAVGDTQHAKDLVDALLADDLDVLICTHGENVLPILRAIRPRVISGKKWASKGSVWTLINTARGIVASYTPNADLLRSDERTEVKDTKRAREGDGS
jgi:8-oxo-dGTP diphosphatase